MCQRSKHIFILGALSYLTCLSIFLIKYEENASIILLKNLAVISSYSYALKKFQCYQLWYFLTKTWFANFTEIIFQVWHSKLGWFLRPNFHQIFQNCDFSSSKTSKITILPILEVINSFNQNSNFVLSWFAKTRMLTILEILFRIVITT